MYCGTTISGRLAWAGSLTVLGEGGELKLHAWATSRNWRLLKHPGSPKGFLLINKLYVTKKYKLSVINWSYIKK